MKQRAFLREGALPVAAPALLAEQPVHRPEDLKAHVLLHTATREKDWEDWLALAQCSSYPGWRVAVRTPAIHFAGGDRRHGVALGLSVLAAADLAAGRLAPVLPRGPRLRLAPYCYVLAPHAPEVARQFAAWLNRRAVNQQERRPHGTQHGEMGCTAPAGACCCAVRLQRATRQDDASIRDRATTILKNSEKMPPPQCNSLLHRRELSIARRINPTRTNRSLVSPKPGRTRRPHRRC